MSAVGDSILNKNRTPKRIKNIIRIYLKVLYSCSNEELPHSKIIFPIKPPKNLNILKN